MVTLELIGYEEFVKREFPSLADARKGYHAANAENKWNKWELWENGNSADKGSRKLKEGRFVDYGECPYSFRRQ